MRGSNFPPVATPAPEYAHSARSANFPPDYLARQQHYAQQHQQHQNSHASAGSMAQATSPSMSLQDGHHNNHHNTPNMKSNPEVPIDPSIAASSPTYPPYSPYAPQGHDMSHYQGHPPPQGYTGWPPQYGHPHGLPGGPYSSPGTAVSSAGSAATAGPRPGQVCTVLYTLCYVVLILMHRILTRFLRFTPSCRSPVPSSTSAPAAAMKKSSACTNVDGMVVRKLMGRSIT